MVIVDLVAHTPNPEEVVTRAGKVCYSSKPYEDIDVGNSAKFIEKVIKSGHTSVLEHVTFTFSIKDISRVATHQLVRHRVGFSYSQESLRYVTLGEKCKMTLPDTILEDEPTKSMMETFYELGLTVYNKMIAQGAPPEDARYVLPMGIDTNIVVTANARALLNFFKLRMCNRTQEELRTTADEMWKKCMEVAPNIFKWAGPACMQGRPCTEAKPCGMPRKINDIGISEEVPGECEI